MPFASAFTAEQSVNKNPKGLIRIAGGGNPRFQIRISIVQPRMGLNDPFHANRFIRPRWGREVYNTRMFSFPPDFIRGYSGLTLTGRIRQNYRQTTPESPISITIGTGILYVFRPIVIGRFAHPCTKFSMKGSHCLRDLIGKIVIGA